MKIRALNSGSEEGFSTCSGAPLIPRSQALALALLLSSFSPFPITSHSMTSFAGAGPTSTISTASSSSGTVSSPQTGKIGILSSFEYLYSPLALFGKKKAAPPPPSKKAAATVTPANDELAKWYGSSPLSFMFRFAPAVHLQILGVTAQDTSTMIRSGQRSIIFLINNGGYTIEVEIHDGPYNVRTEEDLTEAIAIATGAQKDSLCFIEVSFTGSMEVGREIMHAAASSNLKQVSLELVGKSPLLIFDDADVDKAVSLALLDIAEICVESSVNAIDSSLFKQWLHNLQSEIGILADGTLALRQVLIQVW
ncbi:hypothetical protein Ahy_B01g054247 [Arachis hypogaea]|uniref:pyruvate decarboxylase n=1 Tax=Arachis hypogaea TaxID=3818 RepID=A0A445ATL3_ARAHY|nr:hypothetical protein Ahy_B01g054247 [Arachis hypogaea]